MNEADDKLSSSENFEVCLVTFENTSQIWEDYIVNKELKSPGYNLAACFENTISLYLCTEFLIRLCLPVYGIFYMQYTSI